MELISVNAFLDDLHKKYLCREKKLDKKIIYDYSKFFNLYLNGEFPISVNIKGPKVNELSSNLGSIKKWCDAWKSQSKINLDNIEFKQIGKTSGVGLQTVPTKVTFNNVDEIACNMPDYKNVFSFAKRLHDLLKIMPNLDSYFIKNFSDLYLKKDILDGAFLVVKYIKEHPFCNLYLRQVCISSLDTKFIENNYALISDLADLLLDDSFRCESTDSDLTGVELFKYRYGFKTYSDRVLFRSLDKNLKILNDLDLSEGVELPLPLFNILNVNCKNVFVLENKVSYITFPEVKDSIAIFGGGYAVSKLKNASWLLDKQIYYFGDLDTDGFAILNSFRKSSNFKIKSILMDEQTLLNNKMYSVNDIKPNKADLDYLNEEEKKVYKGLQNYSYGFNRLEQEFIKYDLIVNCLKDMGMLT